MAGRPKATNSKAEQELDKLKDQFDEFEKHVKTEFSLDNVSTLPKADLEPQTKMSQKEIERAPGIYLRPSRVIMSREKFNERFRDEYNFQKEYVHFTGENNEIKGEKAEFWTKPFPGVPCEFWEVPVNKPVWAPRYVAERMKGCEYTEISMEEDAKTGGNAESVEFCGKMVAKRKIPRLNALPVSTRKSIFMGANSF